MLWGTHGERFPYTNFHDLNLDWILKMIKELAERTDSLEELVQELQKRLELTEEQVKDILAELEAIKDGKYMDVYIDALGKWIDKNLQQLISRIVKYVFFGLSEDGHFTAYIPDSWDFITFSTNMNFESDLYGHLVMSW